MFVIDLFNYYIEPLLWFMGFDFSIVELELL